MGPRVGDHSGFGPWISIWYLSESNILLYLHLYLTITITITITN